MSERWFADTARFPHDTTGGETVLIDSKKGHLFLFSGTGPCLWQRFIAGGTIDEVVADSVARYGESAQAPTRQFLDELVAAEMLLPGVPAGAADPGAEVPWASTFTAPAVKRYDEISDIISMDPIHEVDRDKGWPYRSEDST
jgi:hypothetical protein